MLSSASRGMWLFKQDIFTAAYKGNVERVRELLDSGVDVNALGKRGSFGYTRDGGDLFDWYSLILGDIRQSRRCGTVTHRARRRYK